MHGAARGHARSIAAAVAGLVALALGLAIVVAPPAAADAPAPLVITSPVAGATYDNVIHVSYSFADLDVTMGPSLELSGPGCTFPANLFLLSHRLTATFELDLRDPDDQDYLFGSFGEPQGIPVGCTPTGVSISGVSMAGDPVHVSVTGFTSSITSLSPATTQYVMPDPLPYYATVGSSIHLTYSCFGARRTLPCPPGATSRLYLYDSGTYTDLELGDASGAMDWLVDGARQGQLGIDLTYPGLPTRPSGKGIPIATRAATTAVTDLTATSTNSSITATWGPPAVWGGGTYAVSLDGGKPVTTQDLTFTANGLVKGTSHTVSVTPSDYSYGAGPTTTVTVTTGPLAASLGTLAQDVAAPTVTTPLTLSGHLLVDGTGTAGLAVALYGHSTTSTWSLLATTTTTTGGAFAFTRTFGKNATVQARYAGTQQVSAGVSAERLVTVRPVLSFVMTTKAGPTVTKVKAGTACLAKVTLTGVHSGTTVYLQYYGSGAWHTISGGTAVSTATAASIAWTPTGTGARPLRVYVRADSTRASGTSSTYTLTVT